MNSCYSEGLSYIAPPTLLTIVPVPLNEQLEGVAHNGPEVWPLIQSCPQEAGQGTKGLKKVHWSRAKPWQQGPDLEMGGKREGKKGEGREGEGREGEGREGKEGGKRLERGKNKQTGREERGTEGEREGREEEEGKEKREQCGQIGLMAVHCTTKEV